MEASKIKLIFPWSQNRDILLRSSLPARLVSAHFAFDGSIFTESEKKII